MMTDINSSVQSACAQLIPRYDLTNIVGYALGARSGFFTHPNRTRTVPSFNTLCQDEELTVLRAMCALRTFMMDKWDELQKCFDASSSFIPLLGLPSYVKPTLDNAGHTCLFASDVTVFSRLLTLNDLIQKQTSAIDKYLDAGKKSYLTWLHSIFDFPHVENSEQYLIYCADFSTNIRQYPEHCWYNTPSPQYNMLWNDRVLMEHLAAINGGVALPAGEFQESRIMVHNIPDRDRLRMQASSLEYLKGIMCDESSRIVAVVDSQNLNPDDTFRFFDWLHDEYGDKIYKAILLVDGTEKWQWGKAAAVLHCPVERVVSTRIIKQKSTVDTNLLCRVMREFYENKADTFLIFSGDCDFLPLTENLPVSRFCFFGLSGCVSKNSLRYAEEHKAKFIVMDDHLKSIGYTSGNSDNFVDDLTARLNDKALDVTNLIKAVSEASSYLGRKIDYTVSHLLLNEIFSTYKLKVGADGQLQFSYAERKE